MSPMPTTMRAAVIEKFGGPNVFKLKEVPIPAIDDDEVLIALHTAGVGAWDPDMRSGWVPSGGKPRFPLILGSDGAGTVAAVGRRVRRFKAGDRVLANTFDNPKGGSYAQYVAVPAENVGAVPEYLDLKQAGGLPISGLTALQGLGALQLKKRESIIISGASGAVGTVALQLAKSMGARVLAIASGKDGMALARRLGADQAVDGRSADIMAAAEKFAPDGVDALLALAWDKSMAGLLQAVAKGGRVAYPNGVEPTPQKRGAKIVAYNGEGGARELAALTRAVEKAKLKVPIGASFRLEEVAEAHAKVTEHVLGKVILRLR